MELVDLHCHSTASDGSDTPAELAAMGAALGLKALALTDHDTIDGLAEFLAGDAPGGPELIAGVEISVGYKAFGSLHMVGLFLERGLAETAAALERLQKARVERNHLVIEKLNRLGIALALEEVTGFSAGGQLSRNHFAAALVARGLVPDRNRAFAQYLGAGAPAYVPKEKYPARQAIELIRGVGAVPVLAHPGILQADGNLLKAAFRELKGWGLEAVEGYYSEYNPQRGRQVRNIAAELGLALSGGSDHHGLAKPHIKLGVGTGSLRVPAAIMDELCRRRDEIRARG